MDLIKGKLKEEVNRLCLDRERILNILREKKLSLEKLIKKHKGKDRLRVKKEINPLYDNMITESYFLNEVKKFREMVNNL